MQEATQVTPPKRPEIAKELSPRERAEIRAKELKSHGSDLFDSGSDEFHIDADIVPDGWTYEWKVKTVLNQEDPSYQVQLSLKGWEPVPASRHPDMMPRGHVGEEIVRKGMRLMERPASITAEAREVDRRRAQLQVRTKEEQLSAAPPGQFERSNKGNDLAKVKKGFSAIAIPEA